MAIVSSHTLNGADGTHAGGIPVKLVNLNTGQKLFDGQMDDAGRLSEIVDLTGADPEDSYELVFAAGQYWKALNVTYSPRINEIVLRFTMPDPGARYHMPIILSPNSYSTWASIPE
ncbi:MAG: hydroxyisourate hydrolase [Boseongicola sp.]